MELQREIAGHNPSLIVFMIDQSGSMVDPFGMGGGRKHAKAAEVVNKALETLLSRSVKADYFEIAIIGYGSKVGSVFDAQDRVKIRDLGSTAKLEEVEISYPDDNGGTITQTVSQRVWLKPVASGGTPMCEALDHTHDLVKAWLEDKQRDREYAFPPVVINITDGESSDGNPIEPARRILELKNEEGNVLLINVHLSSKPASPIEYPDSEEQLDVLKDQYANQLFLMSSTLPEYMRNSPAAKAQGYRLRELARGFVYNADINSLTTFIDIGTHSER